MRVLLVEDDVNLARTLRTGLQAQGCNVAVAQDGVDGLWLASEEPFDVVVLDLMLPGLNGYRVLEALRAREVWVPVLVLTAKDGDLDQTDAFDLGADDYVTKPFSLAVLLARLRALVRRGAPERPVLLQAGDLVLDPASRRVTRRDTEVSLTAREYALLEHLLRHRGQVVTKTELLRAVWDPAFDGDVNVVEVYIGYLRRKLDDPFRRHSIQTVRGAGYRLAEDGR